MTDIYYTRSGALGQPRSSGNEAIYPEPALPGSRPISMHSLSIFWAIPLPWHRGLSASDPMRLRLSVLQASVTAWWWPFIKFPQTLARVLRPHHRLFRPPSSSEAVRLALAMGEVVQRAEAAFFLALLGGQANGDGEEEDGKEPEGK